ncbi:MAG: bifunctional oligoribonuclease/PAP phosphatase NrnA [Chloroflexi bacterium]|nr:bifunctional oligoribonuclease/PAP phosphatase NrnA [Chloroflexota bacterium]
MPDDSFGEYGYRPPMRLQDALAGCNRVFLTAHLDPDPDGLGSVMGLFHVLKKEGWNAVPVCVGRLHSFAVSLPGIEDVVKFPSRINGRPPQPIMSAGDALIVCDTPVVSRMAAFYDVHQTILAEGPLINIDHHVTNQAFGTHNFVNPKAGASAEVICDILDASDMSLNADSAKCLMTALVADTQGFRTENTSPHSLALAQRLWEAGAPMFPVAQLIFSSRPISFLRLWGAAMDNMGAEDGIVWASVTERMLENTGATMEESEGLVDFLLNCREARAAVVFKEQNGETKVSVRTVPGVDAVHIVSVFGGGGHQRAAGCTISSDPEHAVKQLIPVARNEIKTGGRRA